MKHQKFSFVALFMLILSVSAFSFSSATDLRMSPPSASPEIIINECVGECGISASAYATVNSSGMHYFSASGSLCPNTAAYTVIFVNGSTVYQGLAIPSTQFGFYASNNDQIYMVSYLANGQSGVVCKRLGNLTLRIGKPS